MVKTLAMQPAVQIGGRLVTASSWETALRLWWCCRERVRQKRWPEERGAETGKVRTTWLAVGGANRRPIGNGKLLGGGPDAAAVLQEESALEEVA
ncbi:hypothetical protein NDU88_005903 [Pleurodeles waltl]|uniref:Uncharacterized protein n=1 Tax=Pleurodeles waltl TaxID=8319 RepID=A0AAV7UNE9_PLEWA|nr:hypothetical protein NDU88_005903 [Pleurodeles waltl]